MRISNDWRDSPPFAWGVPIACVTLIGTLMVLTLPTRSPGWVCGLVIVPTALLALAAVLRRAHQGRGRHASHERDRRRGVGASPRRRPMAAP